MPESRLRPDEQLHRHRRRAAAARAPGGVRRRGVLARAGWRRSASRRTSSTSPRRPTDDGDEQDAGAVLEGLHPGHRAGVPQAHRSSSSRRSCSRPGRRSSTAPGTASRSCATIIARVRPDVIVEDNVRRLPGARDRRRAVRADHLVQPARDAGRRHRPRRSPARRPTTAPGWAAFRAEYDRTHRDAVGRRSTPGCSRAGRAAAARPRVRPRVERRQPLRLPRGGSTTPTRGRSTRPGTGSTPACARPTSRRRAARARLDRPAGSALVYLSLGSLGSADVELMRRLVDVLGRTAAPLHRVARVRSTPSSSSPTTCGARSSCRRRRSCRWSTSSSPTAATTRRPRRCTSASRWSLLPLFWDQYDNAQRVDELGFGDPARHLRLHRGAAARGDRPAAGRRRAARPARRPRVPTSGRGTGCAAAPT